MNTPTMFALIAVGGYALLYLIACVIFPFRACRRCHGRGTRRNLLAGGGFRQCTKCAGTGRAVRPARRLLQKLNTDPHSRLGHIDGDPRSLHSKSRGQR